MIPKKGHLSVKAAVSRRLVGDPALAGPLGLQIEVGGAGTVTVSDIALWMIDTDDDEESLFVRHCYLSGNDTYQRLKRALKADIDKAAWATAYSTRSRPFPVPKTGKIAVKVINHYGDEVLKVFERPAGRQRRRRCDRDGQPAEGQSATEAGPFGPAALPGRGAQSITIRRVRRLTMTSSAWEGLVVCAGNGRPKPPPPPATDPPQRPLRGPVVGLILRSAPPGAGGAVSLSPGSTD